MSKLKITKPQYRWLFGGVGFHNSEASMTQIMSDNFLNEIILKSFNEISPTFSRLYAGFADWSKVSMDAFADYYEKTFKNASTTLYVVPGRMPMFTKSFDIDEYCEKVAKNLEYLIKERNLLKIRYYCVTNELSCGNTYAYLSKHLDLFKQLHEGLHDAFIRHGIDVGLVATDASGINPELTYWATANIDEITDCYCMHNYNIGGAPGDLHIYKRLSDIYSEFVQIAHKKSKRIMLGEYGVTSPVSFSSKVMINDTPYGYDVNFDDNNDERYSAIAAVETGLSALNAGMIYLAFWTLFDYPNPMLIENGHTKEEKAQYETAKYSGAGIDMRYNKNGLIRWDDDNKNYSSRPSLYTMGYFAKFFKKGSRVMAWECDDKYIRCGAVTNTDGSISICIVNWKDSETKLNISVEHNITKPFRKYTYEAENIPFSKFNDLQACDAVLDVENNNLTLSIPQKSIIYLTTDYVDRTPSEITNVNLSDNKLTWDSCLDDEHTYYRVYENKKQIASVYYNYFNSLELDSKNVYEVYSVDKYGNCNANMSKENGGSKQE